MAFKISKDITEKANGYRQSCFDKENSEKAKQSDQLILLKKSKSLKSSILKS